MKNKICFIAQFPPPIHGLSKAVDTLYRSYLNGKFEFQKVNITNNKKFLKNFITILFSNADLFYFTISQTKYGNIRDLIILKTINMKHKKCVIHLHGGYYRQLIENDVSLLQRKINYRIFSKVDAAIVLTDSLKDNFKNIIPDSKIFTVSNCVDDEYMINQQLFEKKMSNTKKERHILYLSNFIKEKGYMDVLQLAVMEKKSQDKNNKLHFDFAGKFFSKTDEEEFFNFIEENDLKKYVSYHGIVNGEGKKELLKKSDMFILLTRYKKEGQPISILEAMSCGLLVVTTDHAGISDVIKNKKNGLIFNKNYNVSEIYNQIKNLDSNLYQKYVKNAYKDVLNKYSEKEYIFNIEKIFERVIDN